MRSFGSVIFSCCAVFVYLKSEVLIKTGFNFFHLLKKSDTLLFLDDSIFYCIYTLI